MSDIVKRLRDVDVSTINDAVTEIECLRKRLQICQSQDSFPLTGDVITQNERSLLSEVERLRALITEWADAEDAYSTDDRPGWYGQCRDALRKAVGR